LQRWITDYAALLAKDTYCSQSKQLALDAIHRRGQDDCTAIEFIANSAQLMRERLLIREADMSRSFSSSMRRLTRDVDRANRAIARSVLQNAKEAERVEKARLRERVADEKEQRRLYIESRIDEVDSLNEALNLQVVGLSSILVDGLNAVRPLNFDKMRETPEFPTLNVGNSVPPSDLQLHMWRPRIQSFGGGFLQLRRGTMCLLENDWKIMRLQSMLTYRKKVSGNRSLKK
jgi:hypothetical protein